MALGDGSVPRSFIERGSSHLKGVLHENDVPGDGIQAGDACRNPVDQAQLFFLQAHKPRSFVGIRLTVQEKRRLAR